MMRSYFIRHTDKISVEREDLDKIFKQDRIAVHFPGEEKGDSESIDPADYTKEGDRRAIRCFRELKENGGYVWAEYYTTNLVKVGKIIPNSFEVFSATWSRDTRRHNKGDEAKLKTLRIEKAKIIGPNEAMSLRAARPRQGTIVRWKAIKDRLERFIESKPMEMSWDCLFPEQQETVCAEYLREPEEKECPILEFLLLPIGRTLRDVDIYGYTRDGLEIFAQVTNYSKDQPQCRQKIQDLKNYYKKEVYLLFFCKCDRLRREDAILFIPIMNVFEWLTRHNAYCKKLFAS